MLWRTLQPLIIFPLACKHLNVTIILLCVIGLFEFVIYCYCWFWWVWFGCLNAIYNVLDLFWFWFLKCCFYWVYWCLWLHLVQ